MIGYIFREKLVIYQIDRKVCCLGVENGGMGMINIQEFIDSKRIKLLCRILHEPRL
jgi:hypothetical protein